MCHPNTKLAKKNESGYTKSEIDRIALAANWRFNRCFFLTGVTPEFPAWVYILFSFIKKHTQKKHGKIYNGKG